VGGLLLFSLPWSSPALATVAACYRLANVISPADFKIAYNFVTHHGQCLADFEDPAFEAVAAGLTGLIVSGAISPQTCSTLLNDVNSPAVKTLQQTVPDLDIVYEYLDCGCAVATSGIADRIKAIIADMKSCAGSFDPSGAIESGLKKAGTALGFSTLWGFSSNAPDPRAGVGNGGAPTTAYVCAAGGWFKDDGLCASCQFDYGKYSDPSHPGQFWCQPCPQGQALQNGACGVCPSLGSQSANVPNSTRTQCVSSGSGQVTNPCQANQKWNGAQGSGALCCQPWENLKLGSTGQCVRICPAFHVWQGGACITCPANTQPNSANQCTACPQGATAQPGSGCVAAFPLPQCAANQINPPANPYQCMTCPAGTQPNVQQDACMTFSCGGNAVLDPNRANTCMLCGPGKAPNLAHTACVSKSPFLTPFKAPGIKPLLGK
jgi:hypothetical protein